MSFEQQFELPLNFIEQKKSEHVEHTGIDGFIGNLYANYNFQMYKPSKLNSNLQCNKKTKQKSKPSNSKQLQSIKNLIRASNLKQKSTLQQMRFEQRRKQYTEKNRVRHRLQMGRQLQQPHENFQYVDIINVERPNKSPKTKGVTYVDNNKMKKGDRIDDQGQCMVTKNLNKAYDLVPFGDTYQNQKAMYEINRTLHEKSTYRFNVLWWEKQKKTQMERKRQLKDGDRDQINDGILEPEVRKELKRHLKPLRRHKLVSTKYAPFSQFMNYQQRIMQKDVITGERIVDSSQSEQQMEAFKEYDRRLQAEMNPPGAIDLQQSQTKSRKKSKKVAEVNSSDTKIARKMKSYNGKPDYVFQNDQINPKLKRALRKMKDNNWKEDAIFNRGETQEKPIEIE